MVKFAWPNLMLHSSFGSVMNKGGTSDGGSVPVLVRWNEAIEGFVESGGDGMARS